MAGQAAEASGWVDTYESGLAAYRAQDFSGAIGYFQKAIDLRGQDAASSLMIERCKELLMAPTESGWNDTTVARVK